MPLEVIFSLGYYVQVISTSGLQLQESFDFGFNIVNEFFFFIVFSFSCSSFQARKAQDKNIKKIATASKEPAIDQAATPCVFNLALRSMASLGKLKK